MSAEPESSDRVRFWSPPEDHEKPRLPYIVGFTVQIHRHVPPPAEEIPHLSQEYLLTVTQSEAVVANLPPETPAPTRPETAQLTITAPIAVGAARGAQIVACTIVSQDANHGRKHFHATAKIYDPLYYSFKRSIGPYPEDIVYLANRDYSTEAAAYEHLHKTGQTGTFAPDYHGSWTFQLPMTSKGKHLSRPVRLVLMERLYGSTIRDTRVQNHSDKHMGMDSFHYPEKYRLEVLARAMEGFVKQLQTGINQRDFAGRNVMLVGKEDTSSAENLTSSQEDTVDGLALPRIVLIDYNHAVIHKLAEECLLPANPISIFWGEYLCEDFAGWVPHEWGDEELQQDWLLQRFNRRDQQELYLPIPERILETIEMRQQADEGSDARPPTPSNVMIGSNQFDFVPYGYFDKICPPKAPAQNALAAKQTTLPARPASSAGDKEK